MNFIRDKWMPHTHIKLYSKFFDYLTKYTGWNTFVKNSLILLSYSWIAFYISNNNMNFGFSIYSFVFIITVMFIGFFILNVLNINLGELGKGILNNIKENYITILIDKLFWAYSLKSSFILLVSILGFLSSFLGNDIINFENIISVLSFSLISALLSGLWEDILVFILSQNNHITLKIIDNNDSHDYGEYCKDYLVGWLENKFSMSNNYVISKFNLTTRNINTMLHIFNLYSDVDNSYSEYQWRAPLYAFYFSPRSSFVIPQDNIKFLRAVKTEQNRVHLFSKYKLELENRNSILPMVQVVNYIKTHLCHRNGVFIFDKENGILYQLNNYITRDLIEFNDIVYAKIAGKMVPYDPLIRRIFIEDLLLYIKDLDGKFHKVSDFKVSKPEMGAESQMALSNMVCLKFNLSNGQVEHKVPTLSELNRFLTLEPGIMNNLTSNRFI